MNSSPEAEEVRRNLVEALKAQGVLHTPEVIRAMLEVPREEFVPDGLKNAAYVDTPLPTLVGQTISAPHMVAMMTELMELRPGLKVLEIGTGSGYHAAVLAAVVAPVGLSIKGQVVGVERKEDLVKFSKENLHRTGFDDRVTIILGDGTLGCPDRAPYDRILVTAAAPDIPTPLVEQLKVGGRLVIPVGGLFAIQSLTVVDKISETELRKYDAGGCVFVPLIGQYGWKE